MKKFIVAALAASLVATPVLAAPNAYNNNRAQVTYNDRDHGQVRRTTTVRQTVVHPNVRQTTQSQQRQWRTGQRFDRQYASNYREIRNPRTYRLNTPPRGYHWVQSGNDAVLVGITSGIISAIISGALR